LKIKAPTAQNEIKNTIIGGCGVDLDIYILMFFCWVDDAGVMGGRDDKLASSGM
jgi:hypothetical protein